MRFEKISKPSLSSVTTKRRLTTIEAKGVYLNDKGKVTRHPRQSETPISFVGVDGEGMTVNGRHKYVLFGVGEEQIADEGGLRWSDVFQFLYPRYRPGTAFTGFFLGYDFTQIFATLPEDRARMLLTTEGQALRRHRIPGKAPHPVEHEGWQFDVLASKRLRIRPKGCECEYATCKCKHPPWMYVCDVGSFFQSSFLTVIDPKGWADGTQVVSNEEYAAIEVGKKKRSTAVLDTEMRFYNKLENVVLGRVMGTLDRGFHSIGIHLPPSKWFGPGQAAQAWLKKEGVPTREDHTAVYAKRDGKLTLVSEGIPVWFMEAARMSYYGGWFEQFIHGIIPGKSHEYDVNSAYPHIIASLPCLLHGRYTKGDGLPDSPQAKDLVLVYGKVWSPNMPESPANRPQHIGSMLHRNSDGGISRPTATEGWFWWDELQAAQRAGLVKRLDNRGKQQILRWVKYEPCECLPPMRGIRDLYQKRLDVGKTSPLGKAAKLVYNSDYGKFAQSVGDPIYGNPIYASRITSGCRKQILDAIATHPKGKANVAMVATDGVYFLDKHPSLSVSPALGDWEYKERSNLTLFKPGVYWDDSVRAKIANGGSPHFKARGFKASDFVNALARIDSEYERWGIPPTQGIANGTDWHWPAVVFTASFAMTTALQALRQNDWTRAGHVDTGSTLKQDSDPRSKRTGLYIDDYNGRRIYRSNPHYGMYQDGGELKWVASAPYEKRFGMADPWSDEYKDQLGIVEDGRIADILAWILTGE